MHGPLARVRGDEHAEPATFFQDPVVDEDSQAFAGGGGVDLVEGGELVGGGGTLAGLQRAVNDEVLHEARYLHEEGI